MMTEVNNTEYTECIICFNHCTQKTIVFNCNCSKNICGNCETKINKCPYCRNEKITDVQIPLIEDYTHLSLIDKYNKLHNIIKNEQSMSGNTRELYSFFIGANLKNDREFIEFISSQNTSIDKIYVKYFNEIFIGVPENNNIKKKYFMLMDEDWDFITCILMNLYH